MRIDIFNKSVNFNGPIHERLQTQCHIWTGIEKHHHGIYGKQSSHRVIWIHKNGEIPKGQCIRHKCDNGLCVNIEHLELGTRQDNINDMVQRGRAKGGARKGENASNVKLKIDDVKYIRDNPKKLTKKELGIMFNISQSQIYRIMKGERWADTTIQPSKEEEFLNKATQGPFHEGLQTYCLEMLTPRLICTFNNLTTSAHRIAWIIEHKSIPDKMCVLHKCDNAKCINHLHLELGNHEKNMKDRSDRNRTAGRTKHGMTKLTEDNIKYIKLNPDNKLGVELAKELNVSSSCISHIKLGKTWN